jgi:hypothetical protein
MLREGYKSCNFLQFPVSYTFSHPNISLSTLFSNTHTQRSFPPVWETKFQTHTKQ